MQRLHSLASLLLLLVVAASAARPDLERIVMRSPALRDRSVSAVFRIGTTHISYGPLASWGVLTRNVWSLYLAKNPTYTIAGTTYGIELISYLDDMDPADGNTTTMIVERLVNIDKVNILMTPYEGNTMTFIFAAEALGMPCLNEGAFEFDFYPASLFYWTINTMPNIGTLGYECALPLVKAGARTFVYLTPAETWTVPTNVGLQDIVIGALTAGGLMQVGPIYNVSLAQFQTPEVLDPLIEELQLLDADVLTFEFGQTNNQIFIERMRRNNYNPRAYFVWGSGSYPQTREALGWADAWSLISEAYSWFLNDSDALWGSSGAYNNLFLASLNLSSSNADANLAAAISLLDSSLKVTPDISRATLRSTILAQNISTVVGRLQFVNGSVVRPLYCFQNSANATSILTVWPPGVPSYTPIVYPAIISYPPGYFDQFVPATDHTTRNYLIGFLVPFGVIILGLVIAAIAFLIIRSKYHTVFIKKEGNDGTWNDQ